MAICAQVCTSWRRVVSASAAYGWGWAADEPGRRERVRVLRLISKRLCTGLAGGAVYLVNNLIGDEGGRALGAALQVKPAPMQVKPAPGLADRWVGDAVGMAVGNPHSAPEWLRPMLA